MGISREQMDRAIDEHFGYEARDDIAGVLRTLSDDAEHDIVGWPSGPTHGRDGARPFYQTLFADLAHGKVRCLRRLYGDDFLIDESLWSGTAPGRPFGLEGRGRPLQFRLLHVIEFDGSADGANGPEIAGDVKLKREQVWIDVASIIRQLPQGSEAPQSQSQSQSQTTAASNR